MVDPTSDLGEDVDEETAPECEVCDRKIVQDPDHRLITWVDDEGLARHRHFCSEECRAEWDRQEG